MHQVLLSNVYNKTLFFHLNPQAQQVHIYELDPTFSYKNQNAIVLSDASHQYQMQVVDNLLLVHDMDAKTSQLYDLKLPDYSVGLLAEPSHALSSRYLLQSSTKPPVYLSDLIARDERKGTPDESYITKPVMRGDGVVIDPGNTHVLKDAAVESFPPFLL